MQVSIFGFDVYVLFVVLFSYSRAVYFLLLYILSENFYQKSIHLNIKKILFETKIYYKSGSSGSSNGKYCIRRGYKIK